MQKRIVNLQLGHMIVTRHSLLGGEPLIPMLFATRTAPGHDCGGSVRVQGALADFETGAPITNAPVGVNLFLEGETILAVDPYDYKGDPSNPSDDTGEFSVFFSLGLVPCQSTGFPRPDQAEITVVRDGSEHRFMIETNEVTAQFVEPEFSGRVVLELTDPILVPRCEPVP